MKILIILGIIFGIFFIIGAITLRFFKRLLGIKSGISFKQSNQRAPQKGEVVYRDGEVVVMKGDAKRN
ncbi:MAG: hypothetical protein WC313_07825 [Candidatus Kapaibacterium sp.]|jgi:hypothetical protein|nr:hypothetical protein [Candidatus Kapabacteria bacterium]